MFKKQVFILTLVSLFTFLSPQKSFAASPGASFRLDPTRRFVFLTLTNLQSVARVSYVLTYETRGVTKGFEGGFRTFGRQRRSVRRQILGTCSSGRCVYHTNPHGFQLDVTFFLKSGGTTTAPQTLP